MPSYRHTRDFENDNKEELLPLPRTDKEKKADWWRYHWQIVVGIGIAVLFVALFVTEIVRKKAPDLKIGVVSPYNLPDEVIKQLQDEIAPQIGDLNADGVELVSVEVFVVESSFYEQEMADPTAQMAGVTRLVGEMSVDGMYVFISEEKYAQEYQNKFGIFGGLDGTLLDTAEDWDMKTMSKPWAEVPLLSGLNMKSKNYEGAEFDGQEYMENFIVGRRTFTTKVLQKKEQFKIDWQTAWDVLQVEYDESKSDFEKIEK